MTYYEALRRSGFRDYPFKVKRTVTMNSAIRAVRAIESKFCREVRYHHLTKDNGITPQDLKTLGLTLMQLKRAAGIANTPKDIKRQKLNLILGKMAQASGELPPLDQWPSSVRATCKRIYTTCKAAARANKLHIRRHPGRSEIISAAISFHRQYNRPLGKADIRRSNGFSQFALKQHFKGIEDLNQQAGLLYSRPQNSRAVLSKLADITDDLGRPPLRDDLGKHRGLTRRDVERFFKSHGEAVKEARLRKPLSLQKRRQQCGTSLIELTMRLNRLPSASDLRRKNGVTVRETIKCFKSVNRAKSWVKHELGNRGLLP